ncbi:MULTISPECIES: hypothetical protein [unclassified Algibacter]|uniref:hypothetical protein n=1 Tax=unclassified Algibacter TaxID=2615009 RepID=UPI00131BCBDE|nr:MULTISPECIES: hypothetical protein [unclassified Algibacter]MCL5129995.1 hypothetical protein [Algibacter sp. L4_22]
MHFLKTQHNLIILAVLVFSCCSQQKHPFSKEDLAAQQAFIGLIDITLNNVNKIALIDSIKTLKLPTKEGSVKAYEKGGYVDKPITRSEEDRHMQMYRDVMAFINVGVGDCFLPSSDYKFRTEDFVYNVKPCLGELYPEIQDKLFTEFSKTATIGKHVFKEVNSLLALHGTEMGMVQLYDDGYYFIFFEKSNKAKVYSIFEGLSMQIGDHNTVFKDYRRK